MKGFIGPSEICRRLGIAHSTWWRWCRAGDVLPPAPLPGSKKWRVDYIESIAQGEVRPEGRRYFGAHRSATR